MNLPSYDTVAYAENAFQFYSKGNHNMLIAIVKLPNSDNEYNLGFGVWNGETNMIDDKISVNNGDRDQILATVGKTALEYINNHPEIRLLATGSVSKKEGSDEFEMRLRTRLYQMGINQHYDYLVQRYNIEGFKAVKNQKGEIEGDWPNWKGEWVPFTKGTNYDAFSLNLKR
ncbi:DUF6934 family protein [Dyadobacter sp. CY347]|uniref:DUF6934 family protein n=1 Tax=Dyadobacter sp. CY347 TaxID=2909336 RepID=UPI001F36FD3F|nr:hypothetical protein [Dyadobacter sp. CY347]MCF2489907.1 hypothetical protein [Dyadobacter sp. CY347]